MEVVLIIVHPDFKNANVDRERRFSQQKHFRDKKLDSNGTFRFRVPTKGPEKIIIRFKFMTWLRSLTGEVVRAQARKHGLAFYRPCKLLSSQAARF